MGSLCSKPADNNPAAPNDWLCKTRWLGGPAHPRDFRLAHADHDEAVPVMRVDGGQGEEGAMETVWMILEGETILV